MTFASKVEAMEFAINKLVDGNQLSEAEQQDVAAAGVNIQQVEDYVRQALPATESEGED